VDNRRDEWRSWIDSTVREHEVLYERLDSRVHSAEIIANEARAEFRTIREELKKELREIRNAINGDAAGYPGMRQDLAELKGERSRKDMRTGYRWNFWTALIPVMVAQSVILIGLLIVNWGALEAFWNKHNKLGPLEQRIERAKHPKSPRKIYVPRIVPAKAEEPAEVQ